MSEEETVYVKLVSSEGHEFFLEKEIATMGSTTIRTMLDGGFREAQENVIVVSLCERVVAVAPSSLIRFWATESISRHTG